MTLMLGQSVKRARMNMKQGQSKTRSIVEVCCKSIIKHVNDHKLFNFRERRGCTKCLPNMWTPWLPRSTSKK